MCLAVPGQLMSIHSRVDDSSVSSEATTPAVVQRWGRVSFGGIVKEISLAFVPEAEVGDYVLVHVGFALSRIDPLEAEKTLNDLEAIRALNES
jgi:hydrogenase expression/formation protein HypC